MSSLWRIIPVAVALPVVVAAWLAAPSVGIVLAALPVVAWSLLARSRTPGLIAGAVLVALLAATVLPGRVLPGPVASSEDLLTWYAVLAILVGPVAGAYERRRGRLAVFLLQATAVGVVVPTLLCCFGVVARSEGLPGGEGLLPFPAGLAAVEEDRSCGSGGCARIVTVTGPDAAARVRAHLAARGFTLGPSQVPLYTEAATRHTGFLVPHDTWVGYRAAAPDAVRVFWGVDDPLN